MHACFRVWSWAWLCLWHLQRVPLGTGVLIVSTRVTVTTEPSAVPMMGSAGAALAGLVSTAHSVSSPPTPRNKMHSVIYWLSCRTAVDVMEACFPVSRLMYDVKFPFSIFLGSATSKKDNGHFIILLIIYSSHFLTDSAAHQLQSCNLNAIMQNPKGLSRVVCRVRLMLLCMIRNIVFIVFLLVTQS